MAIPPPHNHNGDAGRTGPLSGSWIDRALGARMADRALLNLILDDEALTRGLGDEEARLLIEWLADWAEQITQRSASESDALVRVEQLRRRGRAIRQFVDLWCHRYAHGAALQLMATERFRWPLPDQFADPWELMHHILDFETTSLQAA